MTDNVLLSIEDICLSYGRRHVLCHVRGEVAERDFIVLSGPNGGGKTTLLRLMAGLLPPVAGSIHRRAGLRVGYLPQYRSIDRQFPTTVGEVVLSGLSGAKSVWRPFTAAHRRRAAETMEAFRLTGLERRPIAELSGGQWQRVLLARAVVSQPGLLLLDEPETHLDAPAREELHARLSALHAHCAVVVVSHEDARSFAIPGRRVWHVEEGSVRVTE